MTTTILDPTARAAAAAADPEDGDKRDRLTGRGKPHPCGCGRPVPQSFVRHPDWSGDGVWISTFNVWDGAIGYVDTCGTCAKEAEQATSRELNY